MACTYAKDFIAAHAKEFFTGGMELRMELVGHLQSCPECQDYIMNRAQSALRKVESNPVAAEQFQQVIEVAEDDMKKMQE